MIARKKRTPLRRPRTNNEPTSRMLIRGGAVGVVLAGGLWLAAVLFNGVPGRDYGKLYVSAIDVGNIATHDSVRISGVRVGQVVRSDVAARRARLELQLEPGVEIPIDSTVKIRANGLLGARYIELVPGRSESDLPDGAVLAAKDNALTYGVPEALDTFDEKTRASLGSMVGELGKGLLGQGLALNETVRQVGREVDNANAFLTTFNSQPIANAELLPHTQGAMAGLAASRAELGEMLAPAARAVAPLDRERAAVQRTLDAAPGALEATSAALPPTQRLLVQVRALATSARTTLRDAPPGLRAATVFLGRARTPLRRADGLLRSASKTVGPLLKVTDSLAPVIRPLRGALGSLTPIVDVLGRYGCDIQNFATTWRSMTGYAGPGEGPAGPAMAFRLQLTPPGGQEAAGMADTTSRKDPYAAPCKYKPSVYLNAVKFGGGK